MALPLPPGWTTLQFNDWFNAIHQQALDLRTTNILSRVQAPVMVNAIEYLATGSTSTPLPAGWSALEFTDYMTGIINNANFEYYIWLLGSTPTNLQPNVKERTNYGITPSAPTVVSFMAGSLPGSTTLTRASVGSFFNAGLTLASAAVDTARFPYSASGAGLRGLFVEPAATNSNRNASAGGATPGTPGALPTNWSATNTANGITRTIAASGTEDGIPYGSIRYNGTPTNSGNLLIAFEAINFIAALPGQTWVGSTFLRLEPGSSLANVSVLNVLAPRNSGGSILGGNVQNVVMPTTAALKTQRFDAVGTFGNVNTAFVTNGLFLNYTLGNAFDITLRIGLPQCVQAPAPSSSIVTTAAAATRAADIAVDAQHALPAGFWDAIVQRAAGTTTYSGIDLTAGGGMDYAIPTDPSPVQSITYQMSM